MGGCVGKQHVARQTIALGDSETMENQIMFFSDV